MGCRNPKHWRPRTIADAPYGVFFISCFCGMKNTPDHFWSGGYANNAHAQNKRHNSSDCFEPPDHLNFFGGFFVMW